LAEDWVLAVPVCGVVAAAEGFDSVLLGQDAVEGFDALAFESSQARDGWLAGYGCVAEAVAEEACGDLESGVGVGPGSRLAFEPAGGE
jgi:hypothetical protein